MALPNLNPNLCVVILAGGNSRRMGTNKALLLLDGRPLIARLVEQVCLLSNQIWISANEASPYEFLALPVISDIYVGYGPLAGLHSALLRTERPLVLLLACDLPAVREPLLRRIVQLSEGYDAAIPRTSDGRVHPLCGVYRRTCLPSLDQNLKAGIKKVTDLFQNGTLRLRWIPGDEGCFRDHELHNLNSPEDLEAYRRRSS